MKELLTDKMGIALAIALFGAVVHVCKERLRRRNTRISFGDSIALYITSLFSALVFGLISLLLSDNFLHLYLAIAIGAFMGMVGLTKVTENAVDFIIAIGKK